VSKIITKIYSIVDIKNENVSQALKYFVVGGFCTVIDFAILFIVTHYWGLNYLPTSIVSFMFGTVLNYYLCTCWIFKVRAIENRRIEFMYYIFITVIGLGINTILIWVCTSFLGIYFMVSKLLATFVTYWWNFGARKYFLHTIK